ncbi:MAG: acyl-CoA dehydrogenase, partial [Acidimicrobiia bacterium]|nr:acyl-CoA dehydrogenase [Acidimicrobiia bacterium]
MDEASTRVEAALDRLLSEADFDDPQGFWGAQFDLGLAWVWFPEGHGGLGVSRRYSELVNRRLEEAAAPTWNREFNILGIGMG